jgi:hypothetical protein
MAALDAGQVEALQNSTPTNWEQLDAQLRERSNWDQNRFGGDDKLHVKFFTKAYRNDELSIKENRPIYEDKDCIQIMVPGDKHNIIMRPVWDQDIQRWPAKWKAYKEGREQIQTGTPLTRAPFLTEGAVEELNYLNIRTVEQLANLSDGNMPFMGAAEYKRLAQEFLAKSSGADAMLERIKELEAKLERMASMKESPEAEQKAEQQQAKESGIHRKGSIRATMAG